MAKEHEINRTSPRTNSATTWPATLQVHPAGGHRLGDDRHFYLAGFGDLAPVSVRVGPT